VNKGSPQTKGKKKKLPKQNKADSGWSNDYSNDDDPWDDGKRTNVPSSREQNHGDE